MNRIIGFGLVTAATLALTACSTITGGELIRPGEATGTLELYNNSSETIDVVVISDCDAMSYGFDRLADDEYIPIGGTAAFTLSAGCWDVGGGAIGGGEGYKRLSVAPGGITRLTLE
ncbi:MAG: hypothetical protein ABI414_09050 [Devosia sp.]